MLWQHGHDATTGRQEYELKQRAASIPGVDGVQPTSGRDPHNCLVSLTHVAVLL